MEAILSMSLSQLFGGIAGIVVVLSIFVEITPIKINPVSGFLKWIGSKMNEELKDDVVNMHQVVEGLEKSIASVKSDADERQAVNCRVRILRFGDEIRRGSRHSKENFDQVLSDIDEYEGYCSSHPEFKNNKTALTTARILEEYAHCMDNDDFL